MKAYRLAFLALLLAVAVPARAQGDLRLIDDAAALVRVSASQLTALQNCPSLLPDFRQNYADKTSAFNAANAEIVAHSMRTLVAMSEQKGGGEGRRQAIATIAGISKNALDELNNRSTRERKDYCVKLLSAAPESLELRKQYPDRVLRVMAYTLPAPPASPPQK